ncbi:MAG TPA: DUF3443 family protein [Steroidobacteraceae bacterium]|nr:DUF3443 family protein [Steroidobacteraceae bacterium]
MTAPRHWLYFAACTALALLQAACGSSGGGGTGGGHPPPLPTGANVASLTVDSGPAGTVNTLFVDVTLCAPGTADCRTVDHVLVDTGSSGLRIIASVISPSLALPAVVDAAGDPVTECMQFADGQSYGPLQLADVKIGGETAGSIPVQFIGDPAFAAIPADCAGIGPPENTVQAFGANGVLGIGVFREDCGAACAGAAIAGTYYGCPPSGCVSQAMPLAKQAQNPVWHFAVNNNGAVVVLRAVDPAGAAVVAGALVFGIDTADNNRLTSGNIIHVDATTGAFRTIYSGVTLPASFMDSGSTGLFFNDASIAVCSGSIAPDYYCPASLKSLSATVEGVTGSSGSVAFRVANAESLLTNNVTFVAFSSLAGTTSFGGSFDWGLPFFYGRSVYVAIEGQSTSSGTGPYFAY